MNTVGELDAYFERVPGHVLTVVDQAYFEYIDRPDYPDAVERYLKAGHHVAVLRTFSKIYGLAGLRVGYAVAASLGVRGDGEGAAAVRRDDARPRLRRSRASTTARRSHGVARSTPRGSSVSRRCSSSTASSPSRPSATSSTSTRAPTRTGSSTGCCTKGSSCGRSPASARRPRFASPSARRRSSTCSRRRSDGRSRTRERTVLAQPAHAGAPLRQLPAALLRHARLRRRDLDGHDRAHRRHRATAPDSTWWVSALFIVTFLPSVIVGLVAGPLVDVLSRKRLIVSADLVRLAVFCALPFVGTPLAIIVLAGIAGIANSFFRPAVLAGVPNLVSEADLGERHVAAPGDRLARDRGRPDSRRGDRRLVEPGRRLLDQRGDVPVLGGAARPHTRPGSSRASRASRAATGAISGTGSPRSGGLARS